MEAFCKQKELRRALCLQADNGSCLAYAPHLHASCKGGLEQLSLSQKEKQPNRKIGRVLTSGGFLQAKRTSASLMLASRQRLLPRLRTTFASKLQRVIRTTRSPSKRKATQPKNRSGCFWRRRVDSNHRTGYPAYTLSRGASYSQLEYVSIALANACSARLLFNYTQFFLACQ